MALTQGVPVRRVMGRARVSPAIGPAGFDQPVDWAAFLLIGDPDQRLVQPDEAAVSIFNGAVDLIDRGDDDGAVAALQKALNPRFLELRGKAAYVLGIVLNGNGGVGGL